jgi:fumarate reductase subunit D
MKKLCDRVLEKIKEENISPRPQWAFLVKDCFIWSAFVVSVIVGSLAFCVVLAVSLNNDWDIYERLGRTPFQHIIFSLPYLWIILLILFFWLAYFNYKHTKHGYRYHTFTVLGLSVISSIVLGSIFHTTGIGTRIDRFLDQSYSQFKMLNCCQIHEDVWNQPERGLLGGKIKEVIDQKDFRLEDFSGIVWIVREDDGTIEFEPVRVVKGEEVKIIGKKEDENVFWAKEIRPWDRKGIGREIKFREEE